MVKKKVVKKVEKIVKKPSTVKIYVGKDWEIIPTLFKQRQAFVITSSCGASYGPKEGLVEIEIK